MRIRIISGGHALNTRVVNAETGEDVQGVTSIEWKLAGVGQLAEAKLTFDLVEVDVEGEVK